MSKDELLHAQEIFISSTTAEVIPIVEIDGQPVGEGVPGEITKRVQEGFQKKLSMKAKHLFLRKRKKAVNQCLQPFSV